MDLSRVLEVAAVEGDLKETFSFKLAEGVKKEFVEVCLARGLSTGRVMRELLAQFLAEVRNEQ